MILRIFLFAGLVLHKLIWEIWKRKDSHSSDAAPKSTSVAKRIVKTGKIGVLVFFLVQTLFLNVLPMKDPPSAVRIVGIILYSLGLVMAIVGRVTLASSWRDLEERQILPDQSLVTKGLYRYIRHPIYAGDMLLIVGLELALESWIVIFTLIIVAITIRQTLAEEKLLASSYPGYREYCNQTKRFLPFLV